MFWDSLTQQTRVSQKDDVKVYEILLLPIYVGLKTYKTQPTVNQI
jgi:hypothetical protein